MVHALVQQLIFTGAPIRYHTFLQTQHPCDRMRLNGAPQQQSDVHPCSTPHQDSLAVNTHTHRAQLLDTRPAVPVFHTSWAHTHNPHSPNNAPDRSSCCCPLPVNTCPLICHNTPQQASTAPAGHNQQWTNPPPQLSPALKHCAP